MGVRVVLTGHFAGATKNIAGAQFTKGECYLPGPMANYDSLLRILATYNAWPKGSEEYLAAIERDKENGHGSIGASTEDGTDDSGVDSDQSGSGEGDGHPDSSLLDDAGGLVSSGSGQPVIPSDTQSVYLADQAREKLAKVIKGLDPENDEHWTTTGLPLIAAVEEGMNSGAVSRKDIEAIAPGYDRDSARAASM